MKIKITNLLNYFNSEKYYRNIRQKKSNKIFIRIKTQLLWIEINFFWQY
jgi:hypothetical protein